MVTHGDCIVCTSELFGCHFIEDLLHICMTERVVQRDAGCVSHGASGEPVAVDECTEDGAEIGAHGRWHRPF